MVEFAASYPREEHDWILFPSDVQLRKELFVHWKDAGLAGDHPAKANLHLVQALIDHTTLPGQRIMDVTAGSGSILLGVRCGRDVIAIDIAPHFVQWMIQSSVNMKVQAKPNGTPPQALILQGDCRDLLPLPTDSIIFSPPYATAFNSGESGILAREKERFAAVEQYRQEVGNLGNLNNFLYNRAMADVYQKCYESLKPGGKLSLLIKDRISKGRRIDLGLAAIKMMSAAGFEMSEWHRWKPPGSMFTKIHLHHGVRVIEDEHIIIMEKPNVLP